MAHSFEHAIRWMELAQAQYNQLGDVVVDVCKALGNVAIQDIDTALSQVVRKEEVAERDSRINELIREKEELRNDSGRRNGSSSWSNRRRKELIG